MEATRHRANDQTGAVFSPFFIIYLFGAILPAVLLNIHIRNRIKDYDLGCELKYSCRSLLTFAKRSPPFSVHKPTLLWYGKFASRQCVNRACGADR
jgi:hypothetical protein